MTKSEDFKGTLAHAVALNKSCLIDVHVDANIRPSGTDAWELPPIPYKEPVFGAKYITHKLPVTGLLYRGNWNEE